MSPSQYLSGMRPPSSLPLLFLLAGVSGVSAQAPTPTPSGTLRGVVRDSASGTPVGYALVVLVGREQQAFTSESGRFSLTGLLPGRARLRVQQIGYRAQTLSLEIDTRPRAGDESTTLVVRLARQITVLPEVSVEGERCFGMRDLGSTAEEGGTILNQAYLNAERILTLERKYPFILQFQRLVTHLDSAYTQIDGRVDTLTIDSRGYAPYRAGKVLERGARERVAAFTTSDFAGEEFQKTHCFWYAGRDSVPGFPSYRIEFAPRPDLKSPDWAGSMLVDSASMALLRTETRLVNLPRSGTSILTANCTIFYQPIVASLPQEYQVHCVSSQRGGPKPVRVERWLLIDRRFTGKTPLDSEPPR